jgi:hypothetical protein
MKRTLVTGWFSFEMYGATAGDLMVRDVVCDWLREAGHEYDVALAPPFTGGVDWRAVDSSRYTHLLFVCGPFGDSWDTQQLLGRFAHCRKLGVNLSMLQALDEWNPFDFLIDRDSSRTENPDVALLCEQPKPPVVGLLLVHKQDEYRGRGRHDEANAAIHRLIAAHEMAVVDIDTRLDENRTGLRTSGEIEALIGRMDLVLTTRLHGMVLAIKNGVPVLALDAIAGGAKVTRQARALGWPVCLAAEKLHDEDLESAWQFCLTQQAREKARECAASARNQLHALRADFLKSIDPAT